jgi:arginase
MSKRKAVVIGVASGYGASDPSCQDGPDVLRFLGFLRDLEDIDDHFRWDAVIRLSGQQAGIDPVDAVAEIATRLAGRVSTCLAAGHFPLVIGGDHSCAIGTWSGVQFSLAGRGRLGLIWLDAHMDSHTFRTSPSHAIHGMPLACLLGYGDTRLTGIISAAGTLRPEDVCLIGVRSFEPDEARLLRDLGVRIYLMDEVRSRGFAAVFREARVQVGDGTAGYGISLDLDVFEPAEALGVSTPVPGGIQRDDIVQMLKTLADDSRLLAMEIVEYHPYRDRHFGTARAVHDLCQSLVGASPTTASPSSCNGSEI